MVGPLRPYRGALVDEGRCLNDVGEAYKCRRLHDVLESMQAEKAALAAYMEAHAERRPTKAQEAMCGEEKRCYGCRLYWPRGALLHAPGGRSQVPRRYQFWTEKMWKTARSKDRFCHYCKLEAALKTDPVLLAAGATSDKDPSAAETGGPDLSDPKGVNPDAAPLPTDLPSGGTTKVRPSLITKFLGDVSAGMRSGTVYNLQQFAQGLEMPYFSASTKAVLEGYMLNQAQSNSRDEDYDPTPVIEALQLAYDMHSADPSERAADSTARRVWKASDVSFALTSLSEGGDNRNPNVPEAELSELLEACGHPAMKDIVLTCIEQHVALTDTHVEVMKAALGASLKSLLEDGPISGFGPGGAPSNLVRGTPNDEATGVVSHRVMYSTHGSRWDQPFAIGSRVCKADDNIDAVPPPTGARADLFLPHFFPESKSRFFMVGKRPYAFEGLASEAPPGYSAIGRRPEVQRTVNSNPHHRCSYVLASWNQADKVDGPEIYQARVYFSIDLPAISDDVPCERVDCFYEGDVCPQYLCADGVGAIVVLPEGRQAYLGMFTRLDGCVDVARGVRGLCMDNHLLGDTQGMSIAEVVTCYCRIRETWCRLWIPSDGQPPEPYVETRRNVEKRDASTCVPLSEQQGGDNCLPFVLAEMLRTICTRAQSLDLENVGYRECDDYAMSEDNLLIDGLYRWQGAFALRPIAVQQVERRLTHHSLFMPAVCGFAHFDVAVLTQHGKKKGTVNLSFGPLDVLGGVNYKFGESDPVPFADFTLIRNVRAIVFVPDCKTNIRAWCTKELYYKFTQCCVYFQGDDGSEKYTQLLHGLPVRMPDDFASQHFPDHWELALLLPNVPIVVEYLSERYSPRVTSYAQLVHWQLLLDIVEDDKFYRSKELPEVGVVLAHADHGMGLSGLLMQKELLFPTDYNTYTAAIALSDGVNVKSEDDRLTKCLGDYADAEVIQYDVAAPDPGYIDGDAVHGVLNGSTKKRLFRYTKERVKKNRILQNLYEVKTQPSSARHPFVLRLAIGSKRGSEVRCDEVGVSVKWFLEHHHRQVALMAFNGVWHPDSFTFRDDVRDDDASMPKCHVPWKGAPVAWKHGVWFAIGDVGCSLGSDLAGCVGAAVSEVLRADQRWRGRDASVDVGALQRVAEWSKWLNWSVVPDKVTSLNAASTLNRKHRALKILIEPSESTGHEALLLSSALGRSMLLDVGVRSVIVQAVDRATGWARHAVAYAAATNGTWFVHDADELPLLLCEGPYTGTSGLLAAWAVDIREGAVRGEAPAKRRRFCMPAGVKIPAPPSVGAAREHAVRVSCVAAFEVYVGLHHSGLKVVLTVESNDNVLADADGGDAMSVWTALMVGYHVPDSGIAHSLSYETLWDAAYCPAASEVHLLVGRNGAAEWCPTTLYILDLSDNAWRAYCPYARKHVPIFKQRKPFGFLEELRVVRISVAA